MTTAGYLHEVGVYGSDEDFRALIQPWAEEGLARREPVVFAYDPHKVGLLRQWLPESDAVTYITDTGPYATPAKALGAWRRLVQRHLADGAPRVCIAGDVPHEGYGRPYAGWDRYEAAVDEALGDLPVWAPCLYDARLAPQHVIEQALALHRHHLTADGDHVPNQNFRPPAGLTDFATPPADPLEATTPAVALCNPDPVHARAAVERVAAAVLPPDRAYSAVLAVSEVVTNAHLHGAAPVEVRAWVGDDRVVIRVRDAGAGPPDPFTGLLARDGEAVSGRGLWLLQQLNLDVALLPEPDGFCVRIVV